MIILKKKLFAEDHYELSTADKFKKNLNYGLIRKEGRMEKAVRNKLDRDFAWRRDSDSMRRAHAKHQDLLSVQTGQMNKKDYVTKWGGKINGQKVKGSY